MILNVYLVTYLMYVEVSSQELVRLIWFCLLFALIPYWNPIKQFHKNG